jgi:hypothetical protein
MVNMGNTPEETAAGLERLRAGRKNNLGGSCNGQICSIPADNSACYSSPRPRKGSTSSGSSKPTVNPNPDVHQTPPHSVDAECGIIGSILQDPRATMAGVVAQASPEWFYVPAHITIFNALVALWDKGQAVDLITFTQHLRDVGLLESVGGPSYVTQDYILDTR